MLHGGDLSEAAHEGGARLGGAVGAIDEDGMLRITGRLKELIIGSGGENIAPVPIEDKIKALCPGLSNAMMIGDKRKYNVVLFTVKTTLNPETGTPAGDPEPSSNLPRTLIEPPSNLPRTFLEPSWS